MGRWVVVLTALGLLAPAARAEVDVRVSGEEVNVTATAAPSDERIRGFIEESADDLGLSHIRMPSGAGHDAQEMARIAPVGMIFVPSRDGISHNVTEYTAPDHIEAGANVLLRVVLKRAL